LTKKNKIFFLLSLPRSGNTLFASILNQNPNIAVTANSITFDIITEIIKLKESDIFLNYPDHKSLDNVISNVFNNYFEKWEQKYIIDRAPIMHPINLFNIRKYFDQPIKCIILWRDLLDVLASYVKWFEKEPTAFPNKLGKNIEEKLNGVIKTAAVSKGLLTIENSMKPENKNLCHILRYNDLVENTKSEINKIYEFLEIPKYNHNFTQIKQFVLNNISYNDSILGNNMHTIRENIKKELNPYRNSLPKSIVDKWGHIVL